MSFLHVGNNRGEDGQLLGPHYAALYAPGVLEQLPWREEQFNCALLVLDRSQARLCGDDIALALVRQNVDWIATTGPDAEWLHDRMDEASVRIGRQRQVGDGHPMTSWHEDAVDTASLAQLAVKNWLGNGEYQLALIVGTPKQFDEIVAEIRRLLATGR